MQYQKYTIHQVHHFLLRLELALAFKKKFGFVF
jgi:hypothetical protein